MRKKKNQDLKRDLIKKLKTLGFTHTGRGLLQEVNEPKQMQKQKYV